MAFLAGGGVPNQRLKKKLRWVSGVASSSFLFPKPEDRVLAKVRGGVAFVAFVADGGVESGVLFFGVEGMEGAGFRLPGYLFPKIGDKTE